MQQISNPHDKLFRETFSNLENTREYMRHYLPDKVLKHINLDSLEISKDSFIEESLKDYYSDILYKVDIAESAGYIYLLFEHKSWQDENISLQLLDYIKKIWDLHLKQTKDKKLPLVIPLVFYHGFKKWKIGLRLSDRLSESQKHLKEYIPDFEYILHDLSVYSDDEIKGTVMCRVVILLLKHVFDENFKDHLPGIFSLLKSLSEQESGLKYIETILRYVISTIDNIELSELKTIMDKSLTQDKGDFVMSLADRLINQGYVKGIDEGYVKGIDEGYGKGIDEGYGKGIIQKAKDNIIQILEIRFGKIPQSIIDKLNAISDSSLLDNLLKKAVKLKKINEFENLIFDLNKNKFH